jgi:hypothetical protein
MFLTLGARPKPCKLDHLYQLDWDWSMQARKRMAKRFCPTSVSSRFEINILVYTLSFVIIAQWTTIVETHQRGS